MSFYGIKDKEIIPTFDRVVICPDNKQERTSGGLYLPDESKAKPRTGTVLAAGPGNLTPSGSRIPVSVKPGDHVLYLTHCGDEIEVDGEQLRVLKDADILGLLRPKGQNGVAAEEHALTSV